MQAGMRMNMNGKRTLAPERMQETGVTTTLSQLALNFSSCCLSFYDARSRVNSQIKYVGTSLCLGPLITSPRLKEHVSCQLLQKAYRGGSRRLIDSGWLRCSAV